MKDVEEKNRVSLLDHEGLNIADQVTTAGSERDVQLKIEIKTENLSLPRAVEDFDMINHQASPPPQQQQQQEEQQQQQQQQQQHSALFFGTQPYTSSITFPTHSSPTTYQAPSTTGSSPKPVLSAYEDEQDDASDSGPVRKRTQVKNACTNCQKACKKCDSGRPCPRCVKYGLQDSCADSVRKERKKGVKRGPYKRKNSEDSKTSTPVIMMSPAGTPSMLSQANTPPISAQVQSPPKRTKRTLGKSEPGQSPAQTRKRAKTGSSTSGEAVEQKKDWTKLLVLSQLCSAVLDSNDNTPEGSPVPGLSAISMPPPPDPVFLEGGDVEMKNAPPRMGSDDVEEAESLLITPPRVQGSLVNSAGQVPPTPPQGTNGLSKSLPLAGDGAGVTQMSTPASTPLRGPSSTF